MRIGGADERAAVGIEELAVHRGDLRVGDARPLGGLGGGAAEAAREVREDVALDREEGGEVRRLDGRETDERGGVVPARVVAVVVFAEAVAVAVAVVEPPARPAGERAVDFGEARVGDVRGGHHAAQRPAVDRGLEEAADDGALADGVRERAVLGLQVEGGQERVPRQVGADRREGDGVEAVVPAPEAVHPVLGHEERVAAEVAGLRDGEAPEQVGGGGARLRELRRRGGDAGEERPEVGGLRGAGGVEVVGRHGAVPFAGVFADRNLQRTGGKAPRTPGDQVRGHREGVAAVPAGVVGDEAAGAGGEEKLDAVLVRVGEEERVEAAALGEEVEAQAEAGAVGAREDRGGVREDELPRARGAFGAEGLGMRLVALEGERGAVGAERDEVRDERLVAARAELAEEEAGGVLAPPVVLLVDAEGEVGAGRAERNEDRVDVHARNSTGCEARLQPPPRRAHRIPLQHQAYDVYLQ